MTFAVLSLLASIGVFLLVKRLGRRPHNYWPWR